MRRVAAVVVLAALVAGGCGEEDLEGVAKARSILRESDRFGDSLNAAQAFLDASDAVLEEAGNCAREKSKTHEDCAARYSYGAWLRAQAVAFTQCTLPGILETRQLVENGLGEFLEGKNPNLPPPPDC